MKKAPQHPLDKILEHRIAIIDGAMGTTIRTYGMKEADIRGKRFKDATKSLLNNGDLFTLSKPDMIGDIHRRFDLDFLHSVHHRRRCMRQPDQQGGGDTAEHNLDPRSGLDHWNDQLDTGLRGQIVGPLRIISVADTPELLRIAIILVGQ